MSRTASGDVVRSRLSPGAARALLGAALSLVLACSCTAKADMPKAQNTTPPPTAGVVAPDYGVPLGSVIDPSVRVQDLQGGDVRLGDVLKAGPTLVVFYRGGWCPYCNGQLRDLIPGHHDADRSGEALFPASG
jgi:hypothetical protein